MSTGYVTLSRQSGLLREMQTIAQNIANQSTSGYRREGVVFTEFITGAGGGRDSVSQAAARARRIDLTQGPLSQTASTFDLAIEGEGFFEVQGPDGVRLTRSGRFSRDAAGALVTPDGLQLLDAGGAPVILPPDSSAIAISTDGTISANGLAIGQVGLVRPLDPNTLTRASGALFVTDAGTEPSEDGIILQGYIEGSNVDPIIEIARMIEVQRSYELGQAFIERESDRRNEMIRTLTQ